MTILPVVGLLVVVLLSSSGTPQSPPKVHTPDKKPKITSELTQSQVPNPVKSHGKTVQNRSEFSADIMGYSAEQSAKSSTQNVESLHEAPKLLSNILNVKDLNYEEEVARIFKYISSVYKRVSKEDAQAIAEALVDYGEASGVDPKFAAALIARESAFNTKAVSVTGAKGLGQIKNFNFSSLSIEDPFDIRQNVRGTVKYMSQMLKGWSGKSDQVPLALGSYFQGINKIRKDKGTLNAKAKGYADDIIKIYERISNIEP